MAEYKLVNGKFVQVSDGTGGISLASGKIDRTPQSSAFTGLTSSGGYKPLYGMDYANGGEFQSLLQADIGANYSLSPDGKSLIPNLNGITGTQSGMATSEMIMPMQVAGPSQITTFDNTGLQIDASGGIMNTPGNFDMIMNTQGVSTASQELGTEFDKVMAGINSNPMTEAEKQTAAFREEMKPWGKAQMGMQIASSGLEALSGLYNAYMAKKAYDLSKDSFEFNRALSLTNLENQAKLTNAEMADRQAMRYSMGGASPEDYMAVNAVRGRI